MLRQQDIFRTPKRKEMSKHKGLPQESEFERRWPRALKVKERVQEKTWNQRETKQVRKSPRRLGNTKTITQKEENLSYQVKDGRQPSLI